ncbi:hypothetical protein CRE_32638 [Caenorhabditis remanei]|uniref:F-box domain-containing protein n=1 Tax=Caenorhabditis remanei TaxID=31234 RepID=E3LJR2_CAERE|nr:hypothetical protein CRE_32638 [Caenorhabditis remanei]
MNSQISELLKGNPQALRSIILYEYASGKSVFEGFKNLCDNIGDDVIEFNDFDFWYHQFATGNLDLNYDRSLASHETEKKAKQLSDIPVDIVEKIIKKASWKDVMSLRQVSRDLRSTVDGINFVFKKVSIIVEKFKATMTIDGHSQVYERQSTIDWDHDLTRNYHSNIKRMFTDLKVLSHLPKLLIDHLHITNNQPGIYEYFESIYIDDGNEDWLHFERFFDNLKQFLPVKGVHIHLSIFLDNYILHSLKPEILEEIELSGDGNDNFDITPFEQYKQAKVYKSSGINYFYRENNLNHLVQFDVQAMYHHPKDIINLKNEILESEKFQLGRVFWKANTWYKNGFDNLEKQLVEFTRKESSEPNCRIYVIEERSKKLQIKVTFNSMEIQRLL